MIEGSRWKRCQGGMCKKSPNPAEAQRGRPSGRGGVSTIRTPIVAAIALLAFIVGGAFGPTFAAANEGSGTGAGSTLPVSIEGYNQGLGPETHVPAWAKNRPIHFMPLPKEQRGIQEALAHAQDCEPGKCPLEQLASPEAHTDLGLRCEPGYCPQPPLYYRGGGVEHNPHIYLTFWGKNWNEHPGARTEIREMLARLSGTAYQGIFTQYFDHAGLISGNVGLNSWTDQSINAPGTVNDEHVRNEIEYSLVQQGWPGAGIGNQYIVLPAPGSHYESGFGGNFCAYHGYFTGIGAPYALIPWAGDEPFTACTWIDRHNGYRDWASASAATSHEYGESATDPIPSEGWNDAEYYEITDICSSSDDQLPNGSWVEGQWDNYQNACSLSDASPPQYRAVVEAASNVAYHNATLHGYVNPAGKSTEYHFQWGTSTSYGNNTPSENLGSGTGNVNVSRTISGLKGNTTYHFRVFAKNVENNEVWSEDSSFTTPDWRPAVTAEEATGVAAGAATLHGTVNPEGEYTHYRFEWGTSEAYGSRWPAVEDASAGEGTSPKAVEHTITGLKGKTTYYFRLFAENGEGHNEAKGSFTTPDWSPVVKSETATEVSPHIYTLHGKINPEGFGTHYRYEWGPSTAYGSKYESPTELTGTSEVAVSHQIEGLEDETTYYFRIVAESKEGSGEAKGEFKTPAWRPTVTTEQASSVTASEATLRASVNPNGRETKYFFEYGTGTGYGSKTAEVSAGSGTKAVAVSQTVTGLSGAAYHFRLVASNSAGTRYGRDLVFSPLPTYSSTYASYGSGSGQLSEPSDLAIDPSGNVWVADTENSRLEEFNPKGEYIRTVGEGSGNGQVRYPYGVAIDSHGNLWVSDTGNDRIEELSSTGTYIQKFGTEGSGNVQFFVPEGLAVDPKGDVYVADRGNKRIEELNEKGEYIRSIGTSGEGQLKSPSAVVLDSAGNLWVSDYENSRIVEFSPEGAFIRSWGTKGTGPGQLEQAYRLTVGPEGNIWLAEWGNNRVQVFTPAGQYVYGFGSNGSGEGQFFHARGIGIFGGEVIALDSGEFWRNTGNGRVEKWTN